MPKLSELRLAKKALALDVPDAMLVAISKLDRGSTTYAIRKICNENDIFPTASQVKDLKQILDYEIVAEVAEVGVTESELEVFDNSDLPVPDEQEEEIELIPLDIETTSKKTKNLNTAGDGLEGDFNGFLSLDLPDLTVEDIRVQFDDNTIQLEWKKKYGGFTYVLVGSPNSYPVDVRHGRFRWLTKENTITIPKAEARFFTVFAFKEKGALGKQYAQGMSVDDITDLETEAYENEVRLRWNKQSVDGAVKLVRSAPNQRLPMPLTFSNYLNIPNNATAYTDVNVNPGDQYEYRVFTEWRSPGGEINETKGVSVTVVTPSKVPNVEQFSVSKADGNNVEISYLPLERGEIRVYQLKGLPSAELIAAKVSRAEFDLATLESGEYKWLGTRIIGAPEHYSNKVTISAPMLPGQKDSRTYIAISVLGSKALISDVKVVQQVGEIEELSVIDRYDYVLLRVSPPAGASALDVWVLNENAQVGPSHPTRRVQIDDEYRRFGGVIFADGVAGLDKAHALDREPKKIVVRGVSNWDGSDHLGEPSEVIYPGRLEVHYRAVRIGKLTKRGYLPWYAYIFPWLRRRFLEKAAAELNTTDFAKFEVKVVGNRKVRQNQPIKAHHFISSRFPMDRDDPNISAVKQFDSTFKDESIGWMIENREGRFEVDMTREEAEKMVGNSSAAKSARAKRRSRDKRGRFLSENEKFTLYNGMHFHRMLPVTDPTISETVFCIDETQYPVAPIEAKNVALNVVIMGPKRSGKTTYVQALVNYLSNQFAVQMRARLIPNDDDGYTMKKMQEMESFITEGNLPLATQSAKPFASGAGPSNLNDPRKPMKFIFENGEDLPIRELNITDVAGEDMDSLDTMRLYQDEISKADLVIFLVDPLQITQVRVALAGKPLPQAGGADPFDVLLNLSKLMEEVGVAGNPDRKFAVVISKFDGIEDLSATPDNHMAGTITPGLAVTRDPMTNSQATATKLADLEDNVRVHNEALAILERLRAGDFVTLAKNKLPMAQYFVVSALGHSSYNDKLDSAGISSFRISDPIRWAAATKPAIVSATPIVKGLYEDEVQPKVSTATASVAILPDPVAQPLYTNPIHQDDELEDEPEDEELDVSAAEDLSEDEIAEDEVEDSELEEETEEEPVEEQEEPEEEAEEDPEEDPEVGKK